MNYYLIAGEASGDLHGSNVVNYIGKYDKNTSFRGVGGERLAKSGVSLLFGLDRLSFMGFYEVIKNIFTIRRNFKDVKQDILKFKPDSVILIDYPGFNLRMAKWCKQKGFKVIYYIAPQIWAWNEKRVEIIRNYVDLVVCILPFELAFYQKHNYSNVHYVGHPLLDEISINESNATADRKRIAILPGSRKQEIEKLLPIQLDVAKGFSKEEFVIAGISRLKSLYPTDYPENVTIIWDDLYGILRQSKAAIVCSGTATLETAIFNVPQVVIYKTSRFNYQIGKRLAKVQYISLPNLICDKKIVEELIQDDCTEEKISVQLSNLLESSSENFYQNLLTILGNSGASEKAAQIIYDFLCQRD